MYNQKNLKKLLNHKINFVYTMNSEEIIFDKYKQFVISKDKDYVEQIEENLRSLSELFHTSTPLQKMSYSITEEYDNAVIVELNENGDIKVNQHK